MELLLFCRVGRKNGGFRSWGISFPEFPVASYRLGRVQYYSTSGKDKDGLSKSSSNDALSTENILSAAGKAAFSPGDKLLTDIYYFTFFKWCCTISSLRKHMKTILISWDINNVGLICPVIVSTTHGLTKAETIQVKGNNHLCASHDSNFGLFSHKQCLNKKSSGMMTIVWLLL